MSAEVLVFASKSDVFAGWARASVLANALKSQGLHVTFVDRFSSKYDDLLLIARHNILETPFVVVMEGRHTLVRRLGVPSPRDILRVLA